MKYLFFVVLLLACSSVPKKETVVVDLFVKKWAEDYGRLAVEEEVAFKIYLKKIEAFYDENNISEKFPSYLSSLNNNQQLVAHLEHGLPGRFKKRYGSWPVRRSPNYIRYELEQTSELRERLNKSRRERLCFELGQAMCEKLTRFAALQDQKNLKYQYNP